LLSWILIRIGNADPDSGARKLTKLTNKPGFQFFKKDFVPRQVCFMTFLLHKQYFLVKIQLFVTAKSEQDTRYGSGSA
jgi:hypothetical protein